MLWTWRDKFFKKGCIGSYNHFSEIVRVVHDVCRRCVPLVGPCAQFVAFAFQFHDVRPIFWGLAELLACFGGGNGWLGPWRMTDILCHVFRVTCLRRWTSLVGSGGRQSERGGGGGGDVRESEMPVPLLTIAADGPRGVHPTAGAGALRAFSHAQCSSEGALPHI